LNLKQLLEIIQVQRHDFLNHLQVISGLLQLNKTDQAKDYLGWAVQEVSRMSRTARVSMPEVTAALLGGFNEAYKNQVRIDLTVQADFAGCAVPGPVVGKTMESCLAAVLCCLSGPRMANGQMEILLQESGKDYLVKIVFHQSAARSCCHLENRLEPVKAMLAPYGGSVSLSVVDDQVDICLIFPREV